MTVYLQIVLQVYCDFHGHSQIKNFVLYGCPDPSGGTVTEVVEQPTCVCMHMYCACDHTCAHIHTYSYVHIRTYIHTCAHIHAYSYVHIRTYIHTCAHIHAYSYVHIRTYIHTCTYLGCITICHVAMKAEKTFVP